MEFNLITNIEQSIPQAIVFNFDELKKELAEKITPYKSLAVTEDDLKGAKSDKANLNKLKKALNDKRVEVKKEYMQPLEVFEEQIKELVSIVDEGIVNIDSQVKAFENKQQEDKLKEIAAFYAEEFENLTDILPLERIIPDKWRNKSCKMSDIQQEIRDKAFKFKNDINVIKAMKLECEDMMLDAYIKTLDMSAALQEKHDFEARQEALKKSEKQNVEQTDESKDHSVSEEPDIPYEKELKGEILKTIDVRFYDTSEEFRKAMKELTQRYNIKYGNVPKGE